MCMLLLWCSSGLLEAFRFEDTGRMLCVQRCFLLLLLCVCDFAFAARSDSSRRSEGL
jgi:hypothetical protein